MRYILCLFVVFLFSCENKQEVRQKEIKDSITKRQDFTTDSIKQKNTERGYVKPATNGNKEALTVILTEPKVKGAIFTDANVLYVDVLDDGSKRDGYASYLCEVLRDYNTSANRVKVVKASSHNDPNRDSAYGVLLGECWCK